MAFNVFTIKWLSYFGQYDRIDDLITFKLRGNECPFFWHCLAAEFHSSTVIKRFDPLFVWHVCSTSREASMVTQVYVVRSEELRVEKEAGLLNIIGLRVSKVLGPLSRCGTLLPKLIGCNWSIAKIPTKTVPKWIVF